MSQDEILDDISYVEPKWFSSDANIYEVMFSTCDDCRIPDVKCYGDGNGIIYGDDKYICFNCLRNPDHEELKKIHLFRGNFMSNNCKCKKCCGFRYPRCRNYVTLARCIATCKVFCPIHGRFLFCKYCEHKIFQDITSKTLNKK